MFFEQSGCIWPGQEAAEAEEQPLARRVRAKHVLNAPYYRARFDLAQLEITHGEEQAVVGGRCHLLSHLVQVLERIWLVRNSNRYDHCPTYNNWLFDFVWNLYWTQTRTTSGMHASRNNSNTIVPSRIFLVVRLQEARPSRSLCICYGYRRSKVCPYWVHCIEQLMGFTDRCTSSEFYTAMHACRLEIPSYMWQSADSTGRSDSIRRFAVPVQHATGRCQVTQPQ